MNHDRVRRVAGGAFLALAALTMLYYVPTLLITGVNSVRPMLLCIAAICVPLAVGTFLLCGVLPEAAARARLVRTVLWVLFGFYLCAMFAVLFFARIDFSEYAAARAFYLKNQELMTNFVPLETIRLYIRCLIYDFIGVGIPFDNLMGNVLLFMPMALFLPCLFPSMRKFWRFLVLMVAVLVAVEALQFVLCCGSCDIDDVILNLAGTLLVYGIIRIPAVNRLLRRAYIWRDAHHVAPGNSPVSAADAADTAAEPPQPRDGGACGIAGALAARRAKRPPGA